MKNKLLICILALITSINNTGAQGFANTSIQWNIPIASDGFEYMVTETIHTVIDMNGDSFPDFVDAEDQNAAALTPFYNGSQKFWRVYLGNGSGFSADFMQWNIPISSDNVDYETTSQRHNLIDINGDGLPDFVDTENQNTESTPDVFLNGSQKYWKVYLNTGTGFSDTAIQWNIPISSDTQEFYLSFTLHTVMDMDGDGLVDFVDHENQATETVNDVFLNGTQKYWKVYLNTGTGFSATAIQWNIPISTDANEYQIADIKHTIMDMDGDNKPDFVDTENQATESTSDTFLSGSQKYWKIYLNTGSGFSATATQWNIPISTDNEDYTVSNVKHTVIDMNGDKKPDFVDSENQSSETVSDVFLNGSQKYWKVYFNTGTGFSPTASQWNIPIVSDNQDYQISWTRHTVIDMNGDRNPDFVDSENEATETTSDVFLNGSQKYWKVYLNNAPDLGTSDFDGAGTIAVYPNPTKNEFRIQGNDHVSFKYSIFDLTGKLLVDGSAKYNEPINSSALQSGIYLIQTIDDNHIESKLKIIKE